MKAVVAAFNQEKALVGAFSVITNLRMELFGALLATDNNNSPLTHGHFIRHGHGHAGRETYGPVFSRGGGGILMRYNSGLMRGSHLMMVLASRLINMSHYTGLRGYYNVTF